MTTNPGLARELGTWTAVAVVISTIVGSGIFRVPGPVAAGAGTAGTIMLLWIAGGVIALCGALSLAEMATAFPQTGGIYVFLRETYGRWAAFLFGWAMLVVNPAAYAFVAVVGAESLATLVPALEGWERVVGAATLVLLVLINIRPVRVGGLVVNVASWLKVGVLVAVSLAAIGFAPAASPGPVWDIAPGSWAGAGLALVLVMGAYDGWQWVPQLAGEMRDPARSLPRALGLGVAVVMVVYLAANASNVLVLTPAELAASTLVTTDVATRLGGPSGAAAVAALIFFSTLSGNHAGFMTDPRVLFTMAEDGLLFRGVAAVHPRHRTPWVAVMLIGAGAILYLFIRSAEELVATLILGMWPFLALSVVAVFIQRRRQPSLPRPFRVPLYPVVPLVFLAACAGIFASSFAQQPWFTIINLAVLAAGLPVYWIWQSATGGSRRTA